MVIGDHLQNGNESNISIIKNKKQLVSHGNIEGRKVALDIIEHMLKAIDTYEATKRLVRLEGAMLKVDRLEFDLSKKKDIYVIGAGKASFPIAKALEDILKSKSCRIKFHAPKDVPEVCVSEYVFLTVLLIYSCMTICVV